MTRLEWFNLQPKCVQEVFKNNCNDHNTHSSHFDWWINRDNKCGIMGAFYFGDAPEGFDFWYDIDTKMKEFSKFVKVTE
jgi:hypothetical protein